jgi:SAM-dependent methyltransferase
MSDEVSAGLRLFNAPADRNKAVILTELHRILPVETSVLEIGSGSGQHALHFSAAMPGWQWQCSDCGPYYDALKANIGDHPASNLPEPLYLDIADFPKSLTTQVVYCANVVHIMPQALMSKLIEGVSDALEPRGRFILYGPFKYGGQFTTPSNANFDHWLKQRDPLSGIRDIEALIDLAGKQGLQFIEDVSMPANNQLLVFGRD